MYMFGGNNAVGGIQNKMFKLPVGYDSGLNQLGRPAVEPQEPFLVDGGMTGGVMRPPSDGEIFYPVPDTSINPGPNPLQKPRPTGGYNPQMQQMTPFMGGGFNPFMGGGGFNPFMGGGGFGGYGQQMNPFMGGGFNPFMGGIGAFSPFMGNMGMGMGMGGGFGGGFNPYQQMNPFMGMGGGFNPYQQQQPSPFMAFMNAGGGGQLSQLSQQMQQGKPFRMEQNQAMTYPNKGPMPSAPAGAAPAGSLAGLSAPAASPAGQSAGLM